MKLILHIGTEKTGTTSLQKWMGVNRAAILRQGVLYPRALGQSRHIFASMYAADFENADPIAYQIHKIADQTGLERFRESTREKLRAEVAGNADASTCLVSDEGLQAVLQRPEEVERLHKLFGGLYDSVQVVIVLRSQLDYAISLASTFSRLGFTIDRTWFEAISPEISRYNYDRLVRMWENAFGAENVRIMPYKRAPRSIPAFQELLGLKDDADFRGVPRENSYVDWRYIRIVNQMQGDRRHYFRSTLDRLPHSQKVQPGRDFAIAMNEKFMPSNQALIGRRSDIVMEDLLADPDGYGDAGNLDLLKKPLEGAEVIYSLVKKFL